MRRWMLLGAPGWMIGCAAGGLRAGGAAAGMLALMLLPFLRRPIAYPYPRRRGLEPGRLFFAWSGGYAALALWQGALPALLPGLGPPALNCLRAIGILPACILCGRLLTAPLRRRAAAGLGSLFLLAAIVVSILTASLHV